MLREMRPSEFGDWVAFFGISPWGDDRADLRAGMVASVVANVNRDARRRPEPYRATDFMPYRHRDAEQEAAELSRRLLAAFTPLRKTKH